MRTKAVILSFIASLAPLFVGAQRLHALTSNAQPHELKALSASSLAPAKAGSRNRVLAANQRLVGYTVTDAIDVSGAAFGTEGTYTVGALFTPQQLVSYEGCTIVGLRIAAAMNLGRTRTFIYDVSELGMTPLVEQYQRLYEGWNEIYFNNEGYTITGRETMFFGFDYKETAEMVQNEQGGLCGAGTELEGSFYCYGDLGRGEAMYSLSGLGRLCVQLIVDVSSLPLHDLDLTYLDSGFKYKKPGTTIECFATVTNVGRADVAGFQLGYQIDDQQPVLHTIPADSVLKVGADDSWMFACHLPGDIAIGLHTLKVFVSQAGGEAMAERSRNDTLKADFAIYTDSVKRQKAYLEVYTDATSYYSALLNTVIDSLTAMRGMNDLVTVVNVHRPGTPLAVDDAAYLHTLYAYSWPTFTLNRSYFPGEEYIAYDMNYYLDYMELLGAGFSAGILGSMVMQDYLSPSFASIDLQTTYSSDSRRLTVKAQGDVLPEAEAFYGDLALTLMVVEEKVKGSQTVVNSITGRTSTNRNYQHPYVLRGYLTAPTGDGLEVSGGQYTKELTATLDAGWQADNLTIVALITKRADGGVTTDNVRDYDVINATSCQLSQGAGISLPATQTGLSPVVRYSLSGKQIPSSASPKGIYFERQSDGSVRKVLGR